MVVIKDFQLVSTAKKVSHWGFVFYLFRKVKGFFKEGKNIIGLLFIG